MDRQISLLNKYPCNSEVVILRLYGYLRNMEQKSYWQSFRPLQELGLQSALTEHTLSLDPSTDGGRPRNHPTFSVQSSCKLMMLNSQRFLRVQLLALHLLTLLQELLESPKHARSKPPLTVLLVKLFSSKLATKNTQQSAGRSCLQSAKLTLAWMGCKSACHRIPMQQEMIAQLVTRYDKTSKTQPPVI